MKKIFSILITAALILTAAACSSSAPAETEAETSKATAKAAETTPAETEAETTEAETTEAETTAPETEAETTEPETEAAEAETTPAETEAPAPPAAEGDTAGNIALLKEKAPIYGAYLEDYTKYPSSLSIAYEGDVNGTMTRCEMITCMKSKTEAAIYAVAGVQKIWIIVNDYTTYILSEDEKYAICMEGDESTLAELNNGISAEIDIENTEFETGTTEYNGQTYLFEKMTDPSGESFIYADPDTKEIKYMISGGIEMEVLEFSHNIDESLFVIPADYTVMNMNDLMGG